MSKKLLLIKLAVLFTFIIFTIISVLYWGNTLIKPQNVGDYILMLSVPAAWLIMLLITVGVLVAKSNAVNSDEKQM